MRVRQQVFDIGAHLQGVLIGSVGLHQVGFALRQARIQVLQSRGHNVLAFLQRNPVCPAIILQSSLGRLQFVLLPIGFQLQKYFCVGGSGPLHERILFQIVFNQRIGQLSGQAGVGIADGNVNQTRVAAQRSFDVMRKSCNGCLARQHL